MNINLPSFELDVKLGVLNLAGGAFKLCATQSCSSGPTLSAKISSTGVDVEVDGFVNLFGMIQQQAALKITNTEYILELTGRLFLFKSFIRVTSTYGSVNSASFQVYGRLSTDWMNNLKQRVGAFIQDGAKKATQAISDAQGKLDDAQGAFDRAIKELQNEQRKVDSARSKLNNAKNTLISKQNDVNKLCTKQRCSQGRLSGNSPPPRCI